MKILTVNIPLSYVKMIDGLIGEDSLFPSRSELIRVALREFLLREMEMAPKFIKQLQPEIPIVKEPEIDPNLFVQIPLGNNAEGITEYKTFRIVKKESRSA
jgi:Arc/MetJ-type ribon-helix-helix transcriptional regulator